jgi:hypothetical protein
MLTQMVLRCYFIPPALLPEFVSPIFFEGNGAAFILFDVISGKKGRERDRNKEKKFTEMTKVTSEKKRAKREQRLKRS